MFDGPYKRVDNGITRNRDRVFRESFPDQIQTGVRSGREKQRGKSVRKDSVRLFRERNIHSSAAQSGLDVSDGDMSVKR